MKRNLILISITLGLLLLGILGWLLLSRAAAGAVTVITQDGKELYRIDLAQVTESYTIQISGENGSENSILVEHNAISMQSANCPDGLCTRMGALPDGGIPIVCLPHRIVISIETPAVPGDSGMDVRVFGRLP